MNSESNELVQEIAGMIYQSVEEFGIDWKMAVARFQFLDGACKDTYAWVSNSNSLSFYHPELDMEICEKVEKFRYFSSIDENKWCVCLVTISSDRKINIEFEYEDSERWDPKLFDELMEKLSQ
jgi:predicted nucleic acid-binding protein